MIFELESTPFRLLRLDNDLEVFSFLLSFLKRLFYLVICLIASLVSFELPTIGSIVLSIVFFVDSDCLRPMESLPIVGLDSFWLRPPLFLIKF